MISMRGQLIASSTLSPYLPQKGWAKRPTRINMATCLHSPSGKARLLMEIDCETRLACGSKSEIRRTSELQHRLSFVWPRFLGNSVQCFTFCHIFCIHSCEISYIVLAIAFSNLSNPLFSTSSAPSLFLALPLHFDKIASWKSPLSHFFWLVTSKLYPAFLANATHNMSSRERSQGLQVEKEKYLKHSSKTFEH